MPIFILQYHGTGAHLELYHERAPIIPTTSAMHQMRPPLRLCSYELHDSTATQFLVPTSVIEPQIQEIGTK